jgi:hypothetical protein
VEIAIAGALETQAPAKKATHKIEAMRFIHSTMISLFFWLMQSFRFYQPSQSLTIGTIPTFPAWNHLIQKAARLWYFAKRC